MAISPEPELLLCCARTQLTPAHTARIDGLLRSGLNWEFLVSQAIAHGVAPLVYHHLSPHAIPFEAREALREKSMAETRWNLFVAAELQKILALFEQRGIAAAPFKGVSLAAQLYGNLALREGGDLDILLLREQALAARQLLLDLGYQPEYRLTERQIQAYLRYHYAFVLSHPEHGAVVELHWRIAPRFFSVNLDFESILKRLQPVVLEDDVIRGMASGDMLVALCVHGARHCWERLIWLADVAELLRSPGPLDWPAIMRLAEELGVRRMLLLGLGMAAKYLDAPLPDEIKLRIDREPGIAKSTTEWLALFQRPAIEQGLLARMPFHLRCRERIADRLRYTFRLLTTTTVEDWQQVSLPESLAFLYLFLRLPRLLRKYSWLHTS